MAVNLQVQLDDERYERLERRAAETGTSVQALVRRALDEAYPSGRDVRAAVESFLAAEPMPVEDWDVMKAQMLDELYGGKHDD